MAEVRRVARAMADFHARADRSTEISACATVEEVTGQFEANVSADGPLRRPGPRAPRTRQRGVGRPSLPGGTRFAVLGSHRGRPDLRRPWGSSGRRHLLPRGRPEDPRLPRVRRPPALRGRGGRRGLSGHGPREARGRQGVDAIRPRVRGGSRGVHYPGRCSTSISLCAPMSGRRSPASVTDRETPPRPMRRCGSWSSPGPISSAVGCVSCSWGVCPARASRPWRRCWERHSARPCSDQTSCGGVVRDGNARIIRQRRSRVGATRRRGNRRSTTLSSRLQGCTWLWASR